VSNIFVMAREYVDAIMLDLSGRIGLGKNVRVHCTRGLDHKSSSNHSNGVNDVPSFTM
jgi:hypothetical protein